jgi:hemerythrin-like metal-binding protein
MRISHPEVVLIYQERDSVEPAIEHINDLKLKFSVYQFNQKKLNSIAKQKPKILLISSNDVKRSIQLYIDYLEEYGNKIAPHSAILLINNRESAVAYLACENGLFDNYIIINPFNEPHRLKLVLLKELKLIEDRQNDNLARLMSEGDDEFASCIEHGVTLKKSFMSEMNECESSLLSAVNKVIDDNDVRAVLENMITISLNEMNGNITSTTQDVIDQLVTLRKNNQLLNEQIQSAHGPKQKTAVGVNAQSLSYYGDDGEQNSALSYKVLIAEPSDLFSRVIDDMFSDTVYKYLSIHDGEEVLEQVKTFKPDVILMAYDLPTLNGIEVTKILRNNGNKIPVIAYTRANDRKVITHWIPLGLSGYIIKPSKKSTILKSINQAIKNPVKVLAHKGDDINEIKWLPEYSVGNKEMDEQHKMLFSMINEFFHQDSKQAVVKLLGQLTDYVEVHFAAEEYLMRQINYPKTTEHIEIHNALTSKFHLLEEKLDNYNIDLHHKISTFLYNWLTSHILKEDMDYKVYALSIEESSFDN